MLGRPEATDRIGDKRRRWASIGLALGIASIAMIMWLANRPPAANCSGGTIPDSNAHVILASRVVLRPWYGPHQSYGIFSIPNKYRDARYSAAVTIQGAGELAALSESSVRVVGNSVNVHGDNMMIEPGHFVMHAHIRTRVAVWFLVTGHFGDLRATCHWAVTVTSNRG
jgi:hypothetical protein